MPKPHHTANLFIANNFKYYRLPKSIISNRDPRMTNLFWRGLFENLGTKLNLSSAYHPQTYGQSEIANSNVLDLLKNYVNEVDQRNQWEKHLPFVEYEYNNTMHSSIRKTPFEIVKGRSKVPPLLRTHDKTFAYL